MRGRFVCILWTPVPLGSWFFQGRRHFGVWDQPQIGPTGCIRNDRANESNKPCLTTFPAPALMDESITSPGRLLVWIWVNTSHPQLLYHNAALKRRSCWKDVTFQQSKTRWKRFQRGNLLVPVAMWNCCLILMVPGIFSQGKAVCDLYFSMAGWLGRARSSGKPYSEGEQEVKDHLLPQRRAAVTPRGEGLKCKGSPKSCPDSCPL